LYYNCNLAYFCGEEATKVTSSFEEKWNKEMIGGKSDWNTEVMQELISNNLNVALTRPASWWKIVLGVATLMPPPIQGWC
jgi:hypothetical protein